MSISYRVNCGGETSVRIVFSKGKAKRVPSPDRARTYDSCGHLGAGPHSIDTRLRGGLTGRQWASVCIVLLHISDAH